MRYAGFVIAALFTLAACDVSTGQDSASAPVLSGGSSAGSECVSLFRQFDQMEKTMSTPTGWRDRVVAPPELMWMAGRLRQSDCFTLTADLTGMDELPVSQIASGGAEIAPTTVHAGVVTNMNDDSRSRAFFEERGVKVRTIGSPALGRRVYIGPFTTEDSYSSAVTLAKDAGFEYPYPARP